MHKFIYIKSKAHRGECFCQQVQKQLKSNLPTDLIKCLGFMWGYLCHLTIHLWGETEENNPVVCSPAQAFIEAILTKLKSVETPCDDI